MVGRDKKDPSRRLTVALLLLVILHARRATAAPGPVRLEIAEPVGRSALEQGVSTAVRDATAKLEDAGCRQVFSDFRDASGRTIQENLEASGQTAQSYLTGILFYNGYGYRRCDDHGILASTSPGSRVVYICAPQFLEKQHLNPGLAAVLIIHEELHSLGLGENPPDSKQITQQVITRCGR